MKIFALRVLVFCLVQALFAFLFWVGGYNFDQRNFFVAYWTFASFIFGWLAAFNPYIKWNKHE